MFQVGSLQDLMLGFGETFWHDDQNTASAMSVPAKHRPGIR
jgi:hypothetical protein